MAEHKLRPPKKPSRHITIYVIDSRYQAAAGTIDLRGKRGGWRELIEHMRGLGWYNRYKDAPDNTYKDLGDGMYTISPTMMKNEWISYYIKRSPEYITVHK